MSFWLGRLRWWLMPRPPKSKVLDTIHKVAHEFSLMFDVDHALDAYRAIDCPTFLVRGERTRRPAKVVVDLSPRPSGARGCPRSPGPAT